MGNTALSPPVNQGLPGSTGSTSPEKERTARMSEVEEKPQTSEVVSDKSDDKLQIEKEEKQKAEDIVGEMFSEKESKEKETAQTEASDVKEEVKTEEVKTEELKKEEENPAKETEEATGSVEKAKETGEEKEEET